MLSRFNQRKSQPAMGFGEIRIERNRIAVKICCVHEITWMTASTIQITAGAPQIGSPPGFAKLVDNEFTGSKIVERNLVIQKCCNPRS